ncbi:ankyrin repeat-containing domain protein, partial [Baffinella frigidus]
PDEMVPLWVASWNGDADIVRALLQAGVVNIEHGNQGTTPLMEAVAQGYADVVDMLLHAGANSIHDGASPLALAAANNEIDMAVMLIKYGADVNQLSPVHGETAIFDAVREARPDMVKLLIAENANVAIKSLRGSVVLHMAVFREDTQLVQMLMDAGADLEAADRKGVTPL